MEDRQYEDFVRNRITQLRLQSNLSEHRMSLDLDKSGSYIRSITSGAALPSLKELFNIMRYFDVTPAEFFAPMGKGNSLYLRLCERLRALEDGDLEKVATFLDWVVPEK